MRFLILFFALSLCFCIAFANKNKYSREANSKPGESQVNFRTLHKPFRMAKLNIVWSKAQQRLTEPKLRSLYSELSLQDKEEVTFKRLSAEGGDPTGSRAAALRDRLRNTLRLYALDEHFDGTRDYKKHKDPAMANESDDYINKSLFKDKKLAKLWSKAEGAGFTSEELRTLREEFQHHQDKIDQYYTLLDKLEGDQVDRQDDNENAVDAEEQDRFNELSSRLDTNEVNSRRRAPSHNAVRDAHTHLRDNYDRLHTLTATGPLNKEFVEPKVQDLWRAAVEANFTKDELQSLKMELHHYEARLLKLRHLHADKAAAGGDALDGADDMQRVIKTHARKVEKLHNDIANRIYERHSEL